MIAFNNTSEQNLTALAGNIAATKLPLDTFWLDAGWNAGGGVMGYFAQHIGLRGDLRYLRGFKETDFGLPALIPGCQPVPP